MNKIILVIVLFAVLQATNSSLVEEDWHNEVQEEETFEFDTQSYLETAGYTRRIRDVRLIAGNRGIHDGRVEVKWRGRWGTVCDKGFDSYDGKVFCKYLGFPGLQDFFYTALFGRGRGPIWFSNMRCSGNERSPFNCRMNQKGRNNCDHSMDVSIICKKNILLVGGGTPNAGRVMVYVNGRWGTICSDGFDDREAKVICRQLGLRYRNARGYRGAKYGRGQGPILMSDLKCTGNEQQITHCRGSRKTCSHSNDAAVKCQ